jgi:hypothetical protein
VDHVQRQPYAYSGAQRLRADDVAAMDHRFGALRGGLAHRARQRVGAIVAVGDDANLHRCDAY